MPSSPTETETGGRKLKKVDNRKPSRQNIREIYVPHAHARARERAQETGEKRVMTKERDTRIMSVLVQLSIIEE